MGKELSIISVIISCIVFGFMIIEYYKPTSSLAVLIAVLCLSVIGFVCSVIGAKELMTTFSVSAVLLGLIAMTGILIIFLIMLIMGM